jgi:hypothetical protein
VHQNEITFTMKVEMFSAPGLEMRIATATSLACFDYTRSTATVADCVVSIIALFTRVEDSVTACGDTITAGSTAIVGAVCEVAVIAFFPRSIDDSVATI